MLKKYVYVTINQKLGQKVTVSNQSVAVYYLKSKDLKKICFKIENDIIYITRSATKINKG